MKQQHENLSVILDDDTAQDVDAAIDEVIADVNLQYRVRRYRMIGDAMRNELPASIDPDFHHRVMQQVRSQPVPGDARSRPASERAESASWLASSWFRPFAGLAVAASVALVTIALWQPVSQQDGVGDDSLANADGQAIQHLAGQPTSGSAVPVSTRVQSEGMRWKLESESPVLQQKLNAYLVNHTEYSNSMQGLIPQARVAGFDAQQ